MKLDFLSLLEITIVCLYSLGNPVLLFKAETAAENIGIETVSFTIL